MKLEIVYLLAILQLSTKQSNLLCTDVYITQYCEGEWQHSGQNNIEGPLMLLSDILHQPCWHSSLMKEGYVIQFWAVTHTQIF